MYRYLRLLRSKLVDQFALDSASARGKIAAMNTLDSLDVALDLGRGK